MCNVKIIRIKLSKKSRKTGILGPLKIPDSKNTINIEYASEMSVRQHTIKLSAHVNKKRLPSRSSISTAAYIFSFIIFSIINRRFSLIICVPLCPLLP